MLSNFSEEGDISLSCIPPSDKKDTHSTARLRQRNSAGDSSDDDGEDVTTKKRNSSGDFHRDDKKRLMDWENVFLPGSSLSGRNSVRGMLRMREGMRYILFFVRKFSQC